MMAPEIEVADDAKTATGTWYIWMPFTDGDRRRSTGGVGRLGSTATSTGSSRRAGASANLDVDLQIMSPYEDGWAKTP